MIQPEMEEGEIVAGAIKRASIAIAQEVQSPTAGFRTSEVGIVASVSAGVATIRGLPGVGFEELIAFPGGLRGIAFDLNDADVGVVLLGDHSRIQAGVEVSRVGRVMDVPVGDALIGRVVDPLGRPIDGRGPIDAAGRLPIERPSPKIMDRLPVTVPLQTGIKVIDAMVPVGRGQRELILGDRQTGKTSIALGAIVNQKNKNVVCVYCAIGQRGSAVAKVISVLNERGAMDYTVVVVTEGNDSPGLSFIAPYAATSIAEYFAAQGRDVLIVYDDLTHHARAYRELSLLLRRPPGREAYPGDVFYIHSRLLERATHLSVKLGGGSVTALPIIQTEAQDLASYIPTNLISITDGQIYLSPTLFDLGALPAVDVGKSVSRVGGKAQPAAFGAITGNLKLAYSQFEELESFARFGTKLDEHTNQVIEHGRRVRACLAQSEWDLFPVDEQIFVLLALIEGLFVAVPLDKVGAAELAVREACRRTPAAAIVDSDPNRQMTDADRQKVLKIASEALAPFHENE